MNRGRGLRSAGRQPGGRTSSGKVRDRPPTGYVPERFPPALPFTARDYLTHLGRVHGLRGERLAARISECLERLGAAGHADMPLRAMSKGMCQKVAVAQALLAPPGLLVLDEAWTGLDEPAREVLDAVVADRLADGGRVVYVDHGRRRLADLASQRWVVHDGRVAAAADLAPAAGTAESGAGAPATQPPTPVIEVSGGGQSLAAALRRTPGVREVHAGADGLLIHADPAASDAVLRAALAEPGAHVRAVLPEGGART